MPLPSLKDIFSFMRPKATPVIPAKAYKIIVKGLGRTENKRVPFCIVKKGTFANTVDGLEAAVNAGTKDKYGKGAPRIVVIEMKEKRARREGVQEFYVRLKQMNLKGDAVAGVFEGVAQYREFPVVG